SSCRDGYFLTPIGVESAQFVKTMALFFIEQAENGLKSLDQCDFFRCEQRSRKRHGGLVFTSANILKRLLKLADAQEKLSDVRRDSAVSGQRLREFQFEQMTQAGDGVAQD